MLSLTSEWWQQVGRQLIGCSNFLTVLQSLMGHGHGVHNGSLSKNVSHLIWKREKYLFQSYVLSCVSTSWEGCFQLQALIGQWPNSGMTAMHQEIQLTGSKAISLQWIVIKLKGSICLLQNSCSMSHICVIIRWPFVCSELYGWLMKVLFTHCVHLASILRTQTLRGSIKLGTQSKSIAILKSNWIWHRESSWQEIMLNLQESELFKEKLGNAQLNYKNFWLQYLGMTSCCSLSYITYGQC